VATGDAGTVGVAPADAGTVGVATGDAGTVGAGLDARVCTCGGVRLGPRRGVVDLHVKLSTLMGLDDDPALIPGWGPVVADVARQVAFDAEQRPIWAWSVLDENGRLAHHGHTSRRPVAAEAAFVRARDKTCRAPGCTRPAVACDIDHRQEQAKDGGPSHRGNCATACKHHHRLRHVRGFTVHHIHPGLYVWESANGRQYLVKPSGDLVALADLDDEEHYDRSHEPREFEPGEHHPGGHHPGERPPGEHHPGGPEPSDAAATAARPTLLGKGHLYPAVFTNNPEPGPSHGLVRAAFGADPDGLRDEP
jgi:hypothetical protein